MYNIDKTWFLFLLWSYFMYFASSCLSKCADDLASRNKSRTSSISSLSIWSLPLIRARIFAGVINWTAYLHHRTKRDLSRRTKTGSFSSPTLSSDRLLFNQVSLKLRRKVRIAIAIVQCRSIEVFLSLSFWFSYLTRINNYDEHLKNMIEPIVVLFLWKPFRTFSININVRWTMKNFMH